MPDLSKIRTQFNVQVPILFKEYIADKAAAEGASQNQLALDALMATYGTEYAEYEREFNRQQSIAARAQTRDAGATS